MCIYISKRYITGTVLLYLSSLFAVHGTTQDWTLTGSCIYTSKRYTTGTVLLCLSSLFAVHGTTQDWTLTGSCTIHINRYPICSTGFTLTSLRFLLGTAVSGLALPGSCYNKILIFTLSYYKYYCKHIIMCLITRDRPMYA